MGEHSGLRDTLSQRDSGGDVRPVTKKRVSYLLGQRALSAMALGESSRRLDHNDLRGI
jgi:hypothetical protein